MSEFLAALLILVLALIIDLIFGDPPDKIHLTVWMGWFIAFIKRRLKGGSPRIEKLKGVILALTAILVFAIPIYLILFLVSRNVGIIAYVVLAGLILKTTFAVKGMARYTLPIVNALKDGRISDARRMLPYIVRRNPANLTETQILSAAVESIAESTVDGATSPIFYYALLGVPGAVAFRVVNTLDSMVGYKDSEHANIGWFSARLDTMANYVPARITALLMGIAAWILRKDWNKALETIKKDRNKPESLNAGWPMAAMAGALNVKLEKPGFYALGSLSSDEPAPEHVHQALKIMKLTVILFTLLVALPIMALTRFLLPSLFL
ncbi:cobalamin biosynthesis protein [Candidatus Bathyarchaeota archaeon]|nr:cobalamin biosynthesis protein [Candidatus Bathyarchaeota archaeon]